MSAAKIQEIPSGVIVACPISKFEVRHVAGIGVLMRIHYIERADQVESGERTMLQTLLEPEQAAEIEGALKKSVQALEFGRSLKKTIKALRAPAPEPLPAAAAVCQ